jgi:hypothetical protein
MADRAINSSLAQEITQLDPNHLNGTNSQAYSIEY